MSRDDARDYLWQQSLSTEKLPCENPHEIPAIGLPSIADIDPGGNLPVTIKARCRKCGNCLRHRQRLWTARAIDELKGARRTWFCTLTVSPEHRLRLRLRAEKAHLRASRETISSLEPAEQFRLQANELGKEVTLWLKRVREASPGLLRYLLVTEHHKSGDPHCHLLLHEQGDPVTKRVLESRWRLGHSHFRLVDQGDPRAAYYACKYLAKEALTRIRASSRYGRTALVRSVTECLEELHDALRDLRAAEEANGNGSVAEAPSSNTEAKRE